MLYYTLEVVIKMKRDFIGYYRWCDLLTLTGTLFAVIGIFLALSGYTLYAVFCLIISGICDAFDGKLASLHKSDKLEKSYGVELDSLSDIVSFGVAPVLITACSADCNIITYFVFAIYIICGVIRLAYYNAIAINKPEENDHFVGVPITSVAILFPIIWLLSYYIEWFHFNYALFFMLMAALFIMPIKIKKLNMQNKVLLSLLGVIFCIVTFVIIVCR